MQSEDIYGDAVGGFVALQLTDARVRTGTLIEIDGDTLTLHDLGNVFQCDVTEVITAVIIPPPVRMSWCRLCEIKVPKDALKIVETATLGRTRLCPECAVCYED